MKACFGGFVCLFVSFSAWRTRHWVNNLMGVSQEEKAETKTKLN